MLTVVTGPPCSGKSTYAWSRAQDGDIVIDFDRIAQAIGSGSPHDHPDHVRWVTIAMRKAGIESAIAQHRNGATVWVVQTRITERDLNRYHRAGAEIITLEVDKAELHRRATAERPARWHQLIDDWTPPAATPKPQVQPPQADPAARRGRTGRPWLRLRAQVLAASDVCGWCGHHGADAVDHIIPLSRGGPPLDPGNVRPIHGVSGCPVCKVKCNSARGNSLHPPVVQRASRAW